MNTHYNNQDIVSKLRSKIFIFKAKPDILQRHFYSERSVRLSFCHYMKMGLSRRMTANVLGETKHD